MATSGSYQRFVTVDGIRYHHIIDPKTRYPNNTFCSVSVRTADAGWADALSTALFNLTLEEGLVLIESLPGTEAYWIETNGTETFSSGFKN